MRLLCKEYADVVNKCIREENLQLRESLHEKTEALDLLVTENQTLKTQLEDVTEKLKDAQTENKNLIDRWMLEKMKDAEKLNEVPHLHLPFFFVPT
ncbi:hypothetical protein AXF42_Ash015126 [Apostasia shenzhenica]|uniref:Autophagy-related protein 16 domain-containing protein n=1 Tax=Apostasia shenzhenica TaxID=1088818 RepID=A0A2I0AQC8_9ASPA|nr:hypothetical protein AXF42_Ash015126 [Apostasia shenzhenica]